MVEIQKENHVEGSTNGTTETTFASLVRSNGKREV